MERTPNPAGGNVAVSLGGLLSIAKLVPPAAEALPPDEYEARVAEYQRRVAARLPLPLFGRELPQVPAREPNEAYEMVCWGCGRAARRKGNMRTREYGGEDVSCERLRAREAARAGRPTRRWHGRMWGWNITELYCPECFDLWGWADGAEECGFDADDAMPGAYGGYGPRAAGRASRLAERRVRPRVQRADPDPAGGAGGGVAAVAVQPPPAAERTCVV